MKNERRLLPDIIAMWNTTTLTQTEVGKAFGLPAGSIGRLLSEARRDGMPVTFRGPRGRNTPRTTRADRLTPHPASHALAAGPSTGD